MNNKKELLKQLLLELLTIFTFVIAIAVFLLRKTIKRNQVVLIVVVVSMLVYLCFYILLLYKNAQKIKRRREMVDMLLEIEKDMENNNADNNKNT